MTAMKRDKQQVERDLAVTKDMLEEARFLNKKLNEAL